MVRDHKNNLIVRLLPLGRQWEENGDRKEIVTTICRAVTTKGDGENTDNGDKMDGRHSWTTSLGQKVDSSKTYVHNKVKLCCTWDQYLVYATIQKMTGKSASLNKRKRRDGQYGGRMTKTQKMIPKKIMDQRREAQK